MAGRQFQQGDALLLLDVQRDFFEGGTTPVPDGEEIIPVLNDWVSDARERRIPIIAVRDWHSAYHSSFRDVGGEWPVHCVQDTPGSFFHPALRLPHDAIIVSKGTAFDDTCHSAFRHTGLANFLRERGIRRLWIGGVIEEIGVRQTVEEAREAGFEVCVIEDGVRPLDPRAEADARDAMRQAGARLERRPEPVHTSD